MCRSRLRVCSFRVAALALLAVWNPAASAHGSTVPEAGVEVLTRGPVHEAFARTPEAVTHGGPIVAALIPDPVQELPPDRKPDRENVQWIPGYWHWDAESRDFLWISGIWRVPPPGRVWMPGSWHEVRGGRQWVAGFWQSAAVPPAQARFDYLPPPPPPRETVSPSRPPAESAFFVPGHWHWYARYTWEPGFWTEHRPGWVWVSACSCWTPAGYLAVGGYWDHAVSERGMLFAPVRLSRAVVSRTGFVFTPTHAVNPEGLLAALFIRAGCGNYFFGDYFDSRYATAGYRDFCGANQKSAFATAAGTAGATPIPGVDPLWAAEQFQHRPDADWSRDMVNLYQGRQRGQFPRPPHAIAHQTQSASRDKSTLEPTSRAALPNRLLGESMVMVQPLAEVEQKFTLKPVAQSERLREQEFARVTRTLAEQRRHTETRLVDRGQAVTRSDSAPRLVAFAVVPDVLARVPNSRTVPPMPTQVLPKETQGSTGSTPPVGVPVIALASLQVSTPPAPAIPAQGFAKPAPEGNPATPKAAPQLPQPRLLPNPPSLSLQIPNRK